MPDLIPRSAKSRPFTIVAQDPSVLDRKGRPLLTTVDVPAEELAPGPSGYRVRVIDYDSSTGTLYEPQKEEERGGFILPGGIDLDLVVRQETSIDGELVLRSSFELAEGAPVVSIEQVSQGVSVQTEGDDATTRVTVAVPGTQVSHLAGQATGSIIANTANDRTISTVTSVDLDLSRLEVGSIGSLIPTLGALARETASFGF